MQKKSLQHSLSMKHNRSPVKTALHGGFGLMNHEIQMFTVVFIDHESHSKHLNFAVHGTKAHRVVPSVVRWKGLCLYLIEFFVLDTFCWKFGILSHVALSWTSLNWTLCDGRIVLDNGWRLQCVGKYSKDVFFWTRVCFLLECWDGLHTLGKLRIACFLLD